MSIVSVSETQAKVQGLKLFISPLKGMPAFTMSNFARLQIHAAIVRSLKFFEFVCSVMGRRVGPTHYRYTECNEKGEEVERPADNSHIPQEGSPETTSPLGTISARDFKEF